LTRRANQRDKIIIRRGCSDRVIGYQIGGAIGQVVEQRNVYCINCNSSQSEIAEATAVGILAILRTDDR